MTEPEPRPETGAEPLPTSNGTRRLLGLAPWLVVVLLSAELLSCFSPGLNLDTYFHLRIGHEFLTGNWSLWHPGHMSSYSTRDWLPTQWSSEMLMAQFQAWFGLSGVRWLWGAAIAGFVAASYLTCRRQGPAMISVVVTACVVLISTPSLSARPQVISYILTLVFVGAWLKTGNDGLNRWWLIPLMWLWATAHGMWPVGLSIGIVGSIAVILQFRPDRRRAIHLLLNPLGCAIAAACTPLGPGLYGAVLNVTTNISDLYSEWAAPNFRTFGPALMLVMLLVLLTVELRRTDPLPWDRLLFILLATGWAVYSNRTVPVAACIAAPLIARAVAERMPAMYQPQHDRRVVLGGAITGLAAVAVLLAIVPQRGSEDPAWLARRFDPLPAQTKVLSLSYTGSYLSWRYPSLDILNNGYGDQFTRAELVSMKDLFGLQPGWVSRLARLHVDWVLVPPDTPLAYALAHQQGWIVVNHSDDIELLHFSAQ